MEGYTYGLEQACAETVTLKPKTAARMISTFILSFPFLMYG